MIRSKAQTYLSNYQKQIKPVDHQRAFYLAICYVQLGDFANAQQHFEKSCVSMLRPPMLWWQTSQPNWLVDIAILAGRTDLYPDVIGQLSSYKLDKRGGSLMALYAYSIMELLFPTGEDLTGSVQALLGKPKIKDMHAIGLTLQAIMDRNNTLLQTSLRSLLEIHKRQATMGGLRATAEGLLCMPAMSLAHAASTFGMNVQIDSEYFSSGYLNHLRLIPRAN